MGYPIHAAKTFTLEGTEYRPGDLIPGSVWAGLRKRTKQCLLSSRFVRSIVDDEPVTATPTPPRKRGRPPKPKGEVHAHA